MASSTGWTLTRNAIAGVLEQLDVDHPDARGLVVEDFDPVAEPRIVFKETVQLGLQDLGVSALSSLVSGTPAVSAEYFPLMANRFELVRSLRPVFARYCPAGGACRPGRSVPGPVLGSLLGASAIPGSDLCFDDAGAAVWIGFSCDGCVGEAATRRACRSSHSENSASVKFARGTGRALRVLSVETTNGDAPLRGA